MSKRTSKGARPNEKGALEERRNKMKGAILVLITLRVINTRRLEILHVKRATKRRSLKGKAEKGNTGTQERQIPGDREKAKQELEK